MLVAPLIIVLGFLGLTPMGPVIVGLEVATGFILWRTAVGSVRPPVDRWPLVVGYFFFTAGWIVASFGVSGLYPWVAARPNTTYPAPGEGFLILFGGAPTAFGMLAIVGVPGMTFLLRRGRLDHWWGGLLVALAITGSALILWIVPIGGWAEPRRWVDLLDALRAASEYMLPPALLGLTGLVVAVKRQQRTGGAPPPRPAGHVRRIVGIPAAALVQVGALAVTAIVIVASLVYYGSQRREITAPVTPRIDAVSRPTQLLALHIEPSEAAAIRTLVASVADSAGYTVRDFSPSTVRRDGPLVAIEIVRGASTVAVVTGGRELGAYPVELHRLANDRDTVEFTAELAAIVAGARPPAPAAGDH